MAAASRPTFTESLDPFAFKQLDRLLEPVTVADVSNIDVPVTTMVLQVIAKRIKANAGPAPTNTSLLYAYNALTTVIDKHRDISIDMGVGPEEVTRISIQLT